MSESPHSVGVALIVGLGNAGAKYAATRHNAGCWFVERFCQGVGMGDIDNGLRNEKKFNAKIGQLAFESNFGASKVRVMMPTTMMNASGWSVAAVAKFYRIATENILIAHDELDLPPGIARLKLGGGHGGHNGLRDVIAHIGNNFARLRIGIGHPRIDVVDYVLKKPNAHDGAQIDDAIARAIAVMPAIIGGDYAAAMRTLHAPDTDIETNGNNGQH